MAPCLSLFSPLFAMRRSWVRIPSRPPKLTGPARRHFREPRFQSRTLTIKEDNLDFEFRYHRVLNAASREANGIKMLQRTRDSSQKAIRRLPPTGCGALSWRGTTVPGQLLRTERINAGTYPDSIAILGANSSFSSPLNYCSLANNQPLS